MRKTITTLFLVALSLNLTNCSSDDDSGNDTTNPEISIQGPEAGTTYSTDDYTILVDPVSSVTLKAQGTDSGGLENIKATVYNANGNEVFAHTQEGLGGDIPPTEMVFVKRFHTTTAGNYTVIFKATDKSGNTSTTSPRAFEFVD
ncbi:hypothetical protein KO504_17230 [Winogradskyella psychrotolerans]|uniref:hypothetical protein n=1 Tax=Winogradskyella psychrotolerans TaxID=1344585 RepID=UPI001C07C57D|nr:hypothetical protein [Winogradskyella psychrotolerans]MBU2923093.1 hypothetical protein [Winogradskyella psychrotolerans]